MAGVVLNVLRKTHFDWVQFRDPLVGPAPTQPVGDPIDVLQYTDIVLMVRFYAFDIGPSSSLTLGLFPDYVDDPGSSGFGVIPIISTTVAPVLGNDTAPRLFIVGAPVSSQYVTVGLTYHYAASGNASMDMSVDVCLRSPDDTRTATAIDLKALVGRLGMLRGMLAQRAPYLLGQLFESWGLDLRSVRFVVERLAPGWSAKALSDTIVALSPELLASNDPGRVLGAIAHELSHIAQIRSLGWNLAAQRASREAQTNGEIASRSIPTELTATAAWELDPVDPRYTLEAISGRMGQIARNWAKP